MKGYKGFSKGLVCKGKQYAENTVFEEEKAVICECGMHFCKNPLDVLEYYPLIGANGEMHEFAEVESLKEPVSSDQKKFTTTKLKIGAKLNLKNFVKASVNFLFEMAKEGDADNYATMASSGDSAKMASSGDFAQMASSGAKSVVCGIGKNNIAKAPVGSWITLAEYENNGNRYEVVCVKTEYVDGDRIKADTWYELKNGKFEEANHG